MNIVDLLDRPIAFHRAFVSLGAGVTGALMVSQALYWTKRSDHRGGWFHKSIEEWEAETGLTRTEQETARRRLREIGVLQERKEGMPCRIWYRLDTETLGKLIGAEVAENQQTSMRKSRKQVCRIPADKPAENLQTSLQESCNLPNIYTEITTETTAENNTRARARSSPDKPANVDPGVWADFLALRKAKRAPLTTTALQAIEREASKAGYTLQDALAECCARGWQGFRADWVITPQTRAQQDEEFVARLTGRRPSGGRVIDVTPDAWMDAWRATK